MMFLLILAPSRIFVLLIPLMLLHRILVSIMILRTYANWNSQSYAQRQYC